MFRKSDSETPSIREKLPATLEGLRVHDHLCLIYETREEQFATAIPFLRIGLEQGEKCVYSVELVEFSSASEVSRSKSPRQRTEYALSAGTRIGACWEDRGQPCRQPRKGRQRSLGSEDCSTQR
jgi:hypothetical protein